MKFSLPCATYVRFSAVCRWAPVEWPQQYIRSLYVERRNNQLLAIATNVKVAVIELIGPDIGPDEGCFIAFDDALLQQAHVETDYSSSIMFDVMPELQFGTAKTMFGYECLSNIGVFPTDDKIETLAWRNWLPEKLPSVSFGQMQINCRTLEMMAAAAPSGEIVFPQFIDTRIACVVRDFVDKNWIGVFMPMFDGSRSVPKVIIPTW